MPGKKNIPAAAPSPKAPKAPPAASLKAPPAKGTLQYMFANAPKAKREAGRIPREFMTDEKREAVDRDEEVGGQMDGKMDRKATTPQKSSSSFLAPLEDSPSPPPWFRSTPSVPAVPDVPAVPAVNGSSFATNGASNGKSSQSHRTVVEDTDAESETGSEDSLMDFESLLQTARHNSSLPTPESAKKSKTRPPAPASPEKPSRYMFSLKNLVSQMADSKKLDESAARVGKMMADRERAEKKALTGGSGIVTPHADHEVLLEQFANQHADREDVNVQHIMKAVKRAAPISGAEMVFNFFKTGEPKKRYEERVFPQQYLQTQGPKASWHGLFGSKLGREACMQDNFFAEMVATEQKMDAPMFYWVLEEVAKEPDEMFRQRYVEMLLQAPLSMSELLTPEVVKTHFRMLGGRKQALAVDAKMDLEPAQRDPHPGRTRGGHWGELWHFLRLLGHAAPMIAAETREYALSVLLRLCADKLVRMHISLQEAVQLALYQLSSAFADRDWEAVSSRISHTLYTSTPTPHLLLHILSSLPSHPRLHTLRRRLAYAYFLRTPGLLARPIHDIFSISNLANVLHTPRFLTTLETPDREYSRLDAHVQLLDLALDSGSSRTAPRLGQRHVERAAAAAGREMESRKLELRELEGEKAFNGELDGLVQGLNVVLNRIQDLGPGHTERSKCRASLECVMKRVEMIVRTRPRERERGFQRVGRKREREREVGEGQRSLRRFLVKGGGSGAGEEGNRGAPKREEGGGAQGNEELDAAPVT